MADGEYIIKTKISTDGLVAGTKELEAACKRAASSVSNIGKTAQTSVQRSVAAVQKQNQAYAAQLQKVKAIQTELAGTIGQKTETDEYRNLIAQLEKVDTKYIQLIERAKRFLATGGNKKSTTFARMEYDAKRLLEQYKKLKAAAEELERTGGSRQQVDTSGLQTKLEAEQAKLDGLKTKLESAVGGLESNLTEYGQEAVQTGSKTEALRGALSSVANVAKKVGSVLLNVAKKALHAVATGAKKAASGLATLVKKMGGFGSNKSGGVGGSLKTILKYTLGIRSLYALTNKLRTALTDGLSNLKSYSTEANQSITAMENSVTRLKNSVAAAFAPILSVVAPIVTKLINLLATAISYIGAFFAALSGKSTYTKAIASTAGALDDAAGSAGGAADAVDDYLTGLDEVKRFDDDSSSGGGGGGGTSGDSTGVMFEEAEIPGLVTDWADKFKEAWENADFTEIGTTVGTKLKDALDSIPWDAIQEKCNKIAKSVATFINGFVATPGLWETVGKTIGEGINTAVGMYNTFMDTTDFVNIGKAIATTIGNAIKTTDWGEVGRAFAQKLKAAIETLYGFVTNLDFDALGDAIVQFINGAIDNVPTNKFGTAIGKLVNGVATVIVKVFGGVDKGNLTTKIKDFFVNAFNAVDTSLIKQAITTVINAVIDLIALVVGTGETDGVVGNLVDFIKDCFSGINTDKLLLAIDSLTGVLTDVIEEAISAIPLLYILTVLFDAFNAILAGLVSHIPIIGDTLAEALSFDHSANYLKQEGITLGTATGEGVTEGFSCLGTELPTTAATAATKAKAELDNSDGSFTVAGATAASGVVEGLSTAVEGAGAAGVASKSVFKEPWESTGREFQTTSTEITGALDVLPDDLGGISANAYTDVIGEFDEAEGDFSEIESGIVGSFDDLPTELKKKFKEAYKNATNEWKTAKSDFSKISANIISSFSNLASGLKIKFASAFTAAKEAWNSAKSSFSATSADIISSFSNLESGVKIKFTSAYTAAKGVWSGAKTDFTAICNNIISAFSGATNGIKAHFASACTAIAQVGWSSAGANAAKSVLNGMYTVSPTSWCSWFAGKISINTGNTGYYVTRGIISGMYTTTGLGSWASWFIRQVKASLGIHSPSTIMRDEVGVYLGEGVGEGLEKSTGGILKTVTSIADKIVDGFQDGVAGIELETPTLLNGALTGLNYTMPVLASGTVIPPKAVYSQTQTDPTDILDELKVLVAKLTQNNNGVSTTGGGNVIHNVVQINRRTLYEEMRKEEDLVISQSGGV